MEQGSSQNSFHGRFSLLVQPNEEIPINVIAENALINLFINDNLVSQQYNDSLEFIFSTNEIGKHYIIQHQSAGNIYTDSIILLLNHLNYLKNFLLDQLMVLI